MVQSPPKKRGLRVSPRSEANIPQRGNEYLPSPARDTANPPGIPDRAGSLPYDMRFNEYEPASRREVPENRRIERAPSFSRNYSGGRTSPAPLRGTIRNSHPPERDDYSSGDYIPEGRRNRSSVDESGDSLYIEFDAPEEEAMLDDEENEVSSPYEQHETIQDVSPILRKESPSFSSPGREEEKRKRPPSFVKNQRTDSPRNVSPVTAKPGGIKHNIEKEYIIQNYSKSSSEAQNFITHTEGFSGREQEPEYDSFYNDTIQILGGRNWRMEQKQVIRDPDEASYPVRRTKSGLLKAHKYKYYGNEEPSEEERIEEQ